VKVIWIILILNNIKTISPHCNSLHVNWLELEELCLLGGVLRFRFLSSKRKSISHKSRSSVNWMYVCIIFVLLSCVMFFNSISFNCILMIRGISCSVTNYTQFLYICMTFLCSTFHGRQAHWNWLCISPYTLILHEYAVEVFHVTAQYPASIPPTLLSLGQIY